MDAGGPGARAGVELGEPGIGPVSADVLEDREGEHDDGADGTGAPTVADGSVGTGCAEAEGGPGRSAGADDATATTRRRAALRRRLDDRGLVAGPVLRRCAPDEVVVWLATPGPVSVELEVVDLETGERGAVLGGGTARSVRVGERLHVHLAIAHPHHDRFPHDRVLGYDLTVTGPDGASQDLASLGLLDGPWSLGMGGLPLPSFFLRGSATPHLRLLHASCRLLHGAGDDAMVAAHEAVAAHARDRHRRPAVLLLTGDQIYGDEVAGPLARHLADLGAALMGDEDPASVPDLGDLDERPVYGRRQAMLDLGFTSSHGENHVFTAGEYLASALLAWDEHLWPDDLGDESGLGAAAGPDGEVPRGLQRRWRHEARHLRTALDGLPAMRRLLANVPTYAVFDDHDVTDDWNLTAEWVDGVRGNPAGRRVVANALLSAWAVQLWGNQPDTFDAAFLADVERGPGDALDRRLWGFDRWAYTTPTEPPVLMLDTRTQRAFDSPTGGPRLLSRPELERVARLARAAGVGADGPALVVSAVPVFGLEVQERRQRFLVGHTGPYEIDFEMWHANLGGLCDFMDTLVQDLGWREIVFLSGDVHYGMTSRVWWRSGDAVCRVHQLVSSSCKHAGPVVAGALHALGIVVRPDHGRVGWREAPDRSATPTVVDRLMRRAVNTDPTAPTGPVFLAPSIAARAGVAEEPYYAQRRVYLAPEGRRTNVLVGDNNVGEVTVTADHVRHDVLTRVRGRTRHLPVEMPLGEPLEEDIFRRPSSELRPTGKDAVGPG
jgi:hypothetical protein